MGAIVNYNYDSKADQTVLKLYEIIYHTVLKLYEIILKSWESSISCVSYTPATCSKKDQNEDA